MLVTGLAIVAAVDFSRSAARPTFGGQSRKGDNTAVTIVDFVHSVLVGHVPGVTGRIHIYQLKTG